MHGNMCKYTRNRMGVILNPMGEDFTIWKKCQSWCVTSLRRTTLSHAKYKCLRRTTVYEKKHQFNNEIVFSGCWKMFWLYLFIYFLHPSLSLLMFSAYSIFFVWIQWKQTIPACWGIITIVQFWRKSCSTVSGRWGFGTKAELHAWFFTRDALQETLLLRREVVTITRGLGLSMVMCQDPCRQSNCRHCFIPLLKGELIYYSDFFLPTTVSK